MISIENVEVVGWEHAIRGMRNPMNSWDRSDSHWSQDCIFGDGELVNVINSYMVGPNDYTLMKSLAKAGTDDRKFMRMIVVYLDVTAPLYWWKEYDTYKVGTVANSCSTMHKIHSKEFTLDDFSVDFMNNESMALMCNVVWELNKFRNLYLKTKEKTHWWQMIQLLPSSFNQRRTLMVNYEVLANIYKARKNHKLEEWRDFCKWIESLPHHELITGGY